jgi:2,3-dihydroxybiphenyl 1,2-dioxygenase
MAINALSYIGVNSDKLDEWQNFAIKNLGMQKVDYTKKSLCFRMDNQKQRFAISGEPGDKLAFLGWEVENKSDLQIYAERLEAIGVQVKLGNKNLTDMRFVEELLYFDDPAGNRIELVFKPHIDKDKFVPGRPISGFKTDVCGLGHAVLHVSNINELIPFYRDALDFKISDYSFDPISLCFFHVNSRHHSFALIGSGQKGFHHFMVEYQNLDDVGQGYDLLQYEEGAIAYTLGRHTNDFMTSFYAHTPSGFFIESGWGGRIIDPNTWVPHETTLGPSFWGHERLYLPDQDRLKFRKKRFQAAQEGKRSPMIIDCPWLYQNIKNN